MIIIETINERLKHLRKNILNLNQTQFALRLNLTQGYITSLENAQRNFTDRTISDICREFNVNEEWLRTGNGEIFVQQPLDELDALCAKHNVPTVIKNVMLTYLNLNDENKALAEKFFLDLVDLQNSTNNITPQPISSDEVVVISDLSEESKEEVKIFTDAIRHSEQVENIKNNDIDSKKII